jgi:hypothetical protein
MSCKILTLLISLFMSCLVWAGDLGTELTIDLDFSLIFMKGQ